MMSKSTKLFVTGLCLIACVSLSEAARALECYQCGSEVVGDEFCGRTFQEDKIPDVLEKLGNSAVKVCNSSSEFLVPACRKTVEEVNGVVVTKRFCFYINKSDSVNCLKPHDTTQIFCQDCFTDRCNSAPQLVAQKLAFIVIPLILSKLSVL